MAYARSTKFVKLIVCVIFVIFCSGKFLGANGDEWKSKGSINDDRPFRMNKLNLILQKAKRMLPEDDLPRLYAELTVQDRLEIEWKKQKVGGFDDDGEQEALIRRKFLGILNQFNLLDVYSDEFGKIENSVLEKDEKDLFAEVLKKDKKLAKLWKKAETSAFSEQEMAALKVEFSHHIQKIAEYEQLKKEVDRMEEISDNSIQRFKTEGDNKSKLREKHSDLKRAYADLRQNFEYLETKTSDGGSSSESFFKDPRIGELWSLAVKANLSVSELESFRAELGHFEHKINKHEYFLKEAEMARASNQIRSRETDVPEFYQQLQQKVDDYALKVKKWYAELKTRILKSSRHPEL